MWWCSARAGHNLSFERARVGRTHVYRMAWGMGGEARNGELFCGAVFYAVVIINRATGQFSATAYCNLNDCINTYTKATRFIMHVNVCVCVVCLISKPTAYANRYSVCVRVYVRH